MNYIKNALVLIAAIAIVGLYTLYSFCDQFVAVSMLQTVNCKGCAIAEYRKVKPRKVKLDYAKMGTRELRKYCKGKIKGWKSLRKAEMVAALMALGLQLT